MESGRKSPGSQGSKSPSRTQSPKKIVTRYGAVRQIEPKFPNEERFAWQKPKFAADTQYDLPDAKSNRSVIFPSARRVGMSESQNADASKNSTGPGSYELTPQQLEFNSEYSSRRAIRFGAAPRQSMAMKTPSPGAVYDIEKVYWNGPEKSLGIGFNCDSRQPLYNSSGGANADMVYPKMETGPKITIAARFKVRNPCADTPGAIYNVHEKVNFKTGPQFSFGKGKGSRFQEANFMPELD